MSAGDPEDVLRSLRRYVALMLGSPPWTARIQRTRVADDERPIVVVEESAPLTVAHAREGGLTQGDSQRIQTFAIVCYPVLAETAGESRQVAGEVRSLLMAGFSRGLVTTDDPPVNIGAPWRLPVYDFDGVPIGGAGRAGPAEPYMHANVDSSYFNVRPVQDALDELRFTVVANARVSWWAPGRIPVGDPTLAKPGAVSGAFHPG